MQRKTWRGIAWAGYLLNMVALIVFGDLWFLFGALLCVFGLLWFVKSK